MTTASRRGPLIPVAVGRARRARRRPACRTGRCRRLEWAAAVRAGAARTRPSPSAPRTDRGRPRQGLGSGPRAVPGDLPARGGVALRRRAASRGRSAPPSRPGVPLGDEVGRSERQLNRIEAHGTAGSAATQGSRRLGATSGNRATPSPGGHHGSGPRRPTRLYNTLCISHDTLPYMGISAPRDGPCWPGSCALFNLPGSLAARARCPRLPPSAVRRQRRQSRAAGGRPRLPPRVLGGYRNRARDQIRRREAGNRALWAGRAGLASELASRGACE